MKERSLFGITPVVCIAHFLAILWLVSVYSWNPPLPPPKALVVKTVKLTPPPQLIALEESAPLPPPKVEPIPELRPAEVKPTPELKPPEVKPSKPLKPKPLLKKQEKPEKTPPPAPSKPAEPVKNKVQKDLLAKAKEKLGKGEISVATPGKIEKLQIDSLPEAAYQDGLAYQLKKNLKLPKYGEVKIDLTVDKLGNVIKVAVISFQNEENKTYIEKELPELKLPAFGNNFPGQENHTFRNLKLIGGL